mgnify:CR=1 FL=1
MKECGKSSSSSRPNPINTTKPVEMEAFSRPWIIRRAFFTRCKTMRMLYFAVDGFRAFFFRHTYFPQPDRIIGQERFEPGIDVFGQIF